jgi:NAD(P)-dependent dehydrogenase (short-subunit alcohol dehydrogenase family)
MEPQPVSERPRRVGGRLEGKVALVSGGDSGIGRAVVIALVQKGVVGEAFVSQVPMARAGEPAEIALAYSFSYPPVRATWPARYSIRTVAKSSTARLHENPDHR